jgi:DUF1680 family protein
VAIQRGPLVYCLESHDQPAGVDLLDIRIDPDQPLHADWHPTLLGGMTIVGAQGYALDLDSWHRELYRTYTDSAAPPAQPIRLTAIPYFAWANRGPASMRVWIPLKALS